MRRAGAPFLLFALVAIVHFAYLAYYAVDLPHWDEWGIVAGMLQVVSGQPAWLGALHNEHAILPTKLLIMGLYALNGWNITFNLLLNYLGFVGLLVFFPSFVRRPGETYPAYLFFFLVFLLSPTNYENHYSAMQSCFHFVLGFILAACFWLFHPRQTWGSTLAGAFGLVAACLSLACGVAGTVAILAVFALFKFRRREFAQAIVAIAIGAAGIVYLLGALKASGLAPGGASILSWSVWRFWLNLIAFAFGVGQLAWGWGLVALVMTAFPFARLFPRYRRAEGGAEWRLLALVLALFAMLGSVSLGRAGWADSARSSRYFELGMFLLPASAVLWSWVLADRPVVLRRFLIGLWAVAFLSFGNAWDFDVYRRMNEVRSESLNCVRRYFETGEREVCPTTAPVWIDFEQSRQLGLSFVRKLGR